MTLNPEDLKREVTDETSHGVLERWKKRAYQAAQKQLWAVAVFLLIALVLCVLPRQQIQFGASQLQGLVGSYTTLPGPTNLVATPGDQQILLTWSPVSGASGYNVYNTTNNTLLNSTPLTTNFYLNGASGDGTTLTNGTAYSYAVTAILSSGESSPSAAASATPLVQDSKWSTTFNQGGATIYSSGISTGSNFVSAGQSSQTTLLAQAAIIGGTSAPTNAQSRAACGGTWTFTWSPASSTDWPTLYVINHVQNTVYDASVSTGQINGQGTVTVSATEGGILASASFPTTANASVASSPPSTTFNTADVTHIAQMVTNSTILDQPVTVDGTTTGSMSGWTEKSIQMSTHLDCYTQQWFQNHFASPSQISLSFTPASSDITVSAGMSSSAAGAITNGHGSVSDLYSGL